MRPIKIGIAGVTGYAGQDLLRLLLAHPGVKVTYLASSGKSDAAAILRHFGKLPTAVEPFDPVACAHRCETVFLALPHKASLDAVPTLLKAGTRVLDLSAAFRLKKSSLYDEFYGFSHSAPLELRKAVYGLTELHSEALKGARLVAVPGCYPTGALLPLTPLLARKALTGSIVIDSKSGVTGAGRGERADLMFAEVNENFKAYGIYTHRHTPEIAQELALAAGAAVRFTFAPHLVPMNRGILTTAYVTLRKPMTADALRAILTARYKATPFVRVLAEGLPDTRGVRGTNFCDIGVLVRGQDAVLVSAIDNLGKGAAGQAVQAFNVQHGFNQTTALLVPAGAP